MEPGPPFAEVLQAAAGGAAWAYRNLWDRHAPGIAGYLRAQGAGEPDELTSEVFLAAFRGLPRFEGDEAGFRGLLFTVARRRLVDEHRARSRRVPTARWTPDADDRRAPSAEEQALGGLGTAQARTWLETLSPDQREVIELRVLGDLDVAQVARIVGKRPGAVKALQRRGLEALRRHVERGGLDLTGSGTGSVPTSTPAPAIATDGTRGQRGAVR